MEGGKKSHETINKITNKKRWKERKRKKKKIGRLKKNNNNWENLISC